jgi:hypothetical protein
MIKILMDIIAEKRGVISMPVPDLIEMARAIRQSCKAKSEKHPVELINQETARSFNELLDESKSRCPNNQFINTMQLTAPSRTQLSGLLAKLDILEDCLKAE